MSNETLKSLSIELNENYKDQYNKIIRLMENFGFSLKQKKHDPIYDDNEKFSKVYNCIFSR